MGVRLLFWWTLILQARVILVHMLSICIQEGISLCVHVCICVCVCLSLSRSQTLGLPARQFSFMFLLDDSFMSFAAVLLNLIRNISLSQNSGLLWVCLLDEILFMFFPDDSFGVFPAFFLNLRRNITVSLSQRYLGFVQVCLQHKILFRFLPDDSFMVSAACLFSSMMFLSMWHPRASSALKLKGSYIHDHELFVSSFAMMAVLGWEGFWFHVVQTRTFLLNLLQQQTFSPNFCTSRGAGSQLLHRKHSKVLLWTLRASFAYTKEIWI